MTWINVNIKQNLKITESIVLILIVQNKICRHRNSFKSSTRMYSFKRHINLNYTENDFILVFIYKTKINILINIVKPTGTAPANLVSIWISFISIIYTNDFFPYQIELILKSYIFYITNNPCLEIFANFPKICSSFAFNIDIEVTSNLNLT